MIKKKFQKMKFQNIQNMKFQKIQKMIQIKMKILEISKRQNP